MARGNWPFLTKPNAQHADDDETSEWSRREERDRLARQNAKRTPRHNAPVTEVNRSPARSGDMGGHFFRCFDPAELRRP